MENQRTGVMTVTRNFTPAPHKKILAQLSHKGAMEGIAVVAASEAHTSQDCCGCNRRE
jgi:transposase